jgi:hypothetical protein
MASPFAGRQKKIIERGRFCRPILPVPAEGEQVVRMISSLNGAAYERKGDGHETQYNRKDFHNRRS